jgi:hypothetical protein
VLPVFSSRGDGVVFPLRKFRDEEERVGLLGEHNESSWVSFETLSQGILSLLRYYINLHMNPKDRLNGHGGASFESLSDNEEEASEREIV